jgi:hypothetical protein
MTEIGRKRKGSSRVSNTMNLTMRADLLGLRHKR